MSRGNDQAKFVYRGPACPTTGKVSYQTRGDARKEINRLRRSPNPEEGKRSAYRCRACGFYHIGRKNRQRKGA